MKVITPQITWHNRDPVLCADFDPTVIQTQSSAPPNDTTVDEPIKPFYRIVTGGADSHLVIWHLSDYDTLKPELVCVADLTRHTKAVNAVRFSPDGSYLASADDDAYIYLWKHDKEKDTPESECWNVDKGLRRHLEDVADLSWSADGNFLVSASVDNSAVLWDVKKGTPIHIWSEHVGFVQGASYDPLGEFVATMATDRNLRVFNPKSGKVISKAMKYPKIWLPNAVTEEPLIPAGQEVSTGNSNEPEIQSEESQKKKVGPSKKLPPGFVNRLFQDDTMKTFCRRLNFSPQGEFLVVPGGLLPPNPLKGKPHTNGESNSTPSSTTSDKKKKKRFLEKDELEQNDNAVVLFCRNSFTHPCGLIPTGTSYSIGSRFCPIYFQRGREPVQYDTTVVNPTRKAERLISCTGRIRKPTTGKNLFLNMPYRMVFAVITNKEVLLCDTESLEPMGIVKNIHCTRLSDLSWSADGRLLFITSTDGYCTIISFSENELGVPVREELPPLDITLAFPVKPPPAKPKKEPKKKEPKAKKTKEVAPGGDTAATPGTSNTSDIKTPKRVSKKPKKKQDKNVHDAPPQLAGTSPISTSTKQETIPAESHSVPASPSVSTPTSSKNNSPEIKPANETPEQPKSPKLPETPKTAPKRATFMDKWVIKTPKTADSENSSPKTPCSSKTPVRDPKMPTLQKEDSDIEIIYEDMKAPAAPPVLKLQVQVTAKEKKDKEKDKEPINFDDLDFDFPPPSSQDSLGSLSQELIHKLQNAPIKVDFQAEDAASQSSVILSSETYEKSKGATCSKPAAKTVEESDAKSKEASCSKPPADILQKSDAKSKEASCSKPVAEIVQKSDANSEEASCSKPVTKIVKESSVEQIEKAETKNPEPTPAVPKTGEKRPATSPLKSEQKQKQPRRVQFITLSSKAGTGTGGTSDSSK